MARRPLLLLTLLALMTGQAEAQQSPPPACTSPERRAFDFWIGDWTVSDSAMTTAYGTNLITREEDGCLIHEHWVGSRGGSGQSLNFWDTETRQWVQVWVGSGGESLRLVGNLDGGRMVLTGKSRGPKGELVEHRAVWSREPDGRVRQYWRSTQDGGKTWQMVIDGWYRQKG